MEGLGSIFIVQAFRNMNDAYIEDQNFEKIDFSGDHIQPAKEYENCSFSGCDFSDTDLSAIIFSECEFSECNFTMAKLNGTSFRDARFKDCKLLGLRFDHCNEFLLAVDFEKCILNLVSFYGLKIKKTRFKDCSLHDADLTGADLSSAIFDNCDLKGAAFENCVLEKADFRTAYNYAFDPELNRVKKAKFSHEGLAGLLGKYEIVIE